MLVVGRASAARSEFKSSSSRPSSEKLTETMVFAAAVDVLSTDTESLILTGVSAKAGRVGKINKRAIINKSGFIINIFSK